MLRRTKIVATLGPSTDDSKTLHDMIVAGLDVARFNFSHGDHEEQKGRLQRLQQAARECGRSVCVIGDLQGPKIRIRRFKNNRVTLHRGDAFYLDSAVGEFAGDNEGVVFA